MTLENGTATENRPDVHQSRCKCELIAVHGQVFFHAADVCIAQVGLFQRPLATADD